MRCRSLLLTLTFEAVAVEASPLRPTSSAPISLKKDSPALAMMPLKSGRDIEHNVQHRAQRLASSHLFIQPKLQDLMRSPRFL